MSAVFVFAVGAVVKVFICKLLQLISLTDNPLAKLYRILIMESSRVRATEKRERTKGRKDYRTKLIHLNSFQMWLCLCMQCLGLCINEFLHIYVFVCMSAYV